MANKKVWGCFSFLLILVCSRTGPDFAGTSTETSTGSGATVRGMVVYNDSTPVFNADIFLHNPQQDYSPAALGKRSANIRSATTRSHADGFFRFDSVDTGHFLIETNDHDSMGALDSAEVRPGDTLVEIRVVIDRFGFIEGRINTSELSHPERASIYLPEIERHAKVDSKGYFIIEKLPAWDYQVRVGINDSLLSMDTDTMSISVKSSDTTRISPQHRKAKNGK